jgi:glutaconate CoA-transferase subunit B
MKYKIEELLAVNISRTIKDGEVGFTGLATGKAAATYATCIPIAAMELAKRQQAPNLTILLCGWMFNADWRILDSLPESIFENRMMELSSECLQIANPAPWAHRRGDISFGFGSGVQVDREGNLNSTCIGSPEMPKVQLVGPIFLPEHMSLFGREYIMMPHHEKRNFVEKVDYISGVGFPGGKAGRDKLGLRSNGPAYICTPKCIFSFDDEGIIYVKSIHPGVTKRDVTENTGFDVGDLSNVPLTSEPTDEELRILREDVDPKGILFRTDY